MSLLRPIHSPPYITRHENIKVSIRIQVVIVHLGSGYAQGRGPLQEYTLYNPKHQSSRNKDKTHAFAHTQKQALSQMLAFHQQTSTIDDTLIKSLASFHYQALALLPKPSICPTHIHILSHLSSLSTRVVSRIVCQGLDAPKNQFAPDSNLTIPCPRLKERHVPRNAVKHIHCLGQLCLFSARVHVETVSYRLLRKQSWAPCWRQQARWEPRELQHR